MRKREIVSVPSEWGARDAGKHFLIEEWSAVRAEHWAISMILAYNRGAGDVQIRDMVGGGMEAVLALGLQTFLRGQVRADEIIPLMDQLLECVRIVRDPLKRDVVTGMPVATPIVGDDDVAEPRTRLWLRSEVLRVHTGFSMADAVSTLISAVMTAPTSRSIQTSPP